MTWTYRDTIPGSSVGGPNPKDDFSLLLNLFDTISPPEELPVFAFEFEDIVNVPDDATLLSFVLEEENAPFVDNLIRLVLKISDTMATPLENASFYLELFHKETNVAPIDNPKSFHIKGINDSISPQNESRRTISRFWLSNTTALSSNARDPGNVNGPNNGTLGLAKTVVLGSQTAQFTSDVGSGIPTNISSFSTAIYRGWFDGTEGLNSDKIIIMKSSSGLFSDIVMVYQRPPLWHLNGSYTFDLIAAGVNTLAKLRSCQIIHRVVDSVAGSGGEFRIDAGCIELGNAI